MKLDVDRLSRLLGAWSTGPGPGTLSGRLADRIAALVDDGTLSDGTLLPTERALASHLGVSRTTATAAYRQLRARGNIESRQGSGSRVCLPPGRPAGSRGANAMLRNLGAVPTDVIDMALAETRVAEATMDIWRRLPPDWLATAMSGTGYHPAGLADLRHGLAGHLAGGGLAAEADGIVVTTGAQQAIALAAQVWCPPGGTVVVEEATFPGALEVFRRLGQNVVAVPTDPGGPVVEAFEEILARHRPSLAYLVPVGANPTGFTTDPRRIEQLARLLDRYRVPVIDDRTPAPLLRAGRAPAHLAGLLPPTAVVTVGSTSKIAWAGIRTGWAVTHPDLATELIAARLASDLAGSVPSQLLLQALLPHLDDLAAQAREVVSRSFDALTTSLTEHLPDWTWSAPHAGAWLWVRTGRQDSSVFAEIARQQGVLITPGAAFSAEARCGDHIRLAAVEPPATVTEGVRRLALAWSDHTRQPHRPTRLPALVI